MKTKYICRYYHNHDMFLAFRFCSGQEYDRYGFVKRYGEDEEEIDPLAVKAEQLERHSEEINNKIKVVFCRLFLCNCFFSFSVNLCFL